MAKHNDTTEFPITTPATDDLLFGTDVSDTGNSVDGESVNFTAGSIADLASVFISTADISSDATVEFTGFDSSTYDGYTFLLQGVELSAAASRTLACKFSTDGGSTFVSTGYTIGGTTPGYFTLGNPNNGEAVSGVLHLPGPHLLKDKVLVIQTSWQGASVGATSDVGHFATTSAVDAIQFYFVSGTLASGTITMYGWRNS